MEYKLNKIDVELRQKVQDITKPGVIHRKEDITINKDKKENELEKEKEDNKNNKELKKRKSEKKISVQATKEKEVEIEAFKDSEEQNYNKKGIFLDARK